MLFFKKTTRHSLKDDIADIEASIWHEWSEAERKQKELAAENHKKKGLQQMPHAIEQLVIGLRRGRA